MHQFKGVVGGNLIRLCRVYLKVRSNNKLNAKTIVWECLYVFLYLWASVHLAFIVAHAHGGQFAPCIVGAC